MMQTALTYFDDSYQYSSLAEILFCGRDESGSYLTFNQTIFYPQGGGQPFDIGQIDVSGQLFPIHAVKWAGEEVRHYTNQEPVNLLGQQATLTIDKDRRVQNSRFHSAGHLLSNVLEKIYPHWKAFKGHHYQENAYVEFMCKEANTVIVNLELLSAEINNTISQDLPISSLLVSPERLKELCPTATYNLNSNLPIRLVQIGDFSYQPCGGTHVKGLVELAGLSITKKKCKGNILRISYSL